MKPRSTHRLGAGWGSLGLLAASIALAGPRTVTIAAGDCRNPELTIAAQTFSLAVAAKVGPEVVTGEAVLERFRPVPTLSSEELGRQLEAAQTQYYAGTYDKALETLRQASTAIARLSPPAQPWKLMSRALMLQALVFKSLGRKSEALEAQARVLRIEPDFKLDVDYYPPATIQAFEGVRKELAKAKRVRLTITSSPGGAQVFLDGAEVGKTPFASELPLGDYRLSLVSGERVSFTRDLRLSRDEALQVDLAFEGALSPQPPLCVAVEPAQRVDTALKLAALAGADSVVVLGLDARNNEPGWVSAVLFEVNKGTKVRDGGIRFVGARRAAALTALAGFVLVGSPSAAEIAALAVPVEPSGPRAPLEAAPPAAVSRPPATVEQRAPRGLGPRIVGIALMGAGAVAAVSGGGLYASGGVDRAARATLFDELNRVRPGANLEEAAGIQRRVDRNSLGSLVLGASGGAALLAGAAVLVLFPPEDGAPRLSLGPAPDGLGATVTLRL